MKNEVSVNLKPFESLIYVNESTWQTSDKPKEGFVPTVVPKFIYEVGSPLPYQIDLKDAIWGQVGEDKAAFRPVNELEFIPLAVWDFGSVCMYPIKDPMTGQKVERKRGTVSVIAYIPNVKHIVSFLLPTWTAANFLAEYRKSGRLTPAGTPIKSPLFLRFKAEKYQTESASKIKVWALKFKVAIMPPPEGLIEFAAENTFYSREHLIEVLSNPVNSPKENHMLAVIIRSLPTRIGEAAAAEIFSEAEGRRGLFSHTEDAEYSVIDSNNTIQLQEPPAPEVPAEKVAAYYKVFDTVFEYLTIEERQHFSIKYNVSREEFKEKGLQLKAVAQEVASGLRSKDNDDDIPF
jgi:hypothetical protein